MRCISCREHKHVRTPSTTPNSHHHRPLPRSTATWQISSGSICHHRFTHSRRPAIPAYMPSPPSAPLPLQPFSSHCSRAPRQLALQHLSRIAHTMSNRAQPFGNSALQCRVVLAYLGAVESIGVAPTWSCSACQPGNNRVSSAACLSSPAGFCSLLGAGECRR